MDEKLQTLLNLTAELANEHDPRSILIKMTEATKRLLHADRCGIFLHDSQRKVLWTIVADGVREIRIPENAGLAGHVLQNEGVLNIPDVYADSRFDRQVDKETGYRTRSMLAIPLKRQNGDTLGVFQAINKLDPGPFTKDDTDLLRHIGLYAASAIESAQLYEQLRKAHEDVIHKLSHATKFKDPETQNHIIRVGLYCEVMAKALGWTPGAVEEVKLAAPMHDIGKVGVPDAILQKPGPLDDAEWVVMKKHTTFGHEILNGADSRLIQVAAVIALEHHEKWSGKGYPAGLAGAKTSVHGRMVALADVFDALTSKRCYKPPWPREKVLGLFQQERGVQFDPELDDLFLKHFDDMYHIKATYAD